jgi:hypothetical protein
VDISSTGTEIADFFLKKIAGFGAESIVRGKDQRIRIRTKISRICNTAVFKIIESILSSILPKPVCFQFYFFLSLEILLLYLRKNPFFTDLNNLFSCRISNKNWEHIW